MTELLSLEHVSARYGALTAVHPLTLTVDAGVRHAVIGPNGAGKSTLLHLIAGSRPTTGGRILFNGRDITGHAPHRRARHGIARTFQHPGVVTALTVGDNMRLALPGARRDRRDAAVADALDRVGLAAHRGLAAGRLAYGQRRLLELGMALATPPALLLLDEPSAGLDPAGIGQVTTILAGLPDQTAVVLVDHHLPLVWAVADTVTVLHHGRHLTTGTPTTVQADPQVRDAYLQPPSANEAAVRTPPQHGAGQAVLLTVRGLRSGYHGADVLHDVDLDLHPGAVHALLGRNGAGKTTLLNTLAGLHPARAGHIQLGGNDLHPPTGVRAGGRVAIAPQSRRLFATLTTAEHLRLADRGLHKQRRWNIDTILELMPSLRDAMDRPPAQLSGGQQQFLALARALLTAPDLLLLDEPTEGLAPTLITQLRHVLTEIAAAGQTVLLAEQNISFAQAVATAITVLDNGHAGPPLDTADLDDPGIRDTLHTRLGIAINGATA
ncbi:ATP-binding cassette domain-containing protein [Actinoplanes sp. NPDC026619]|uniref:ATP-binding cassette domain-containing protein n=1 Tax=Actinoplanes sp. NPDC026619 TaxID=3155798 RepID=UPI0033F63E04